MRCCIALCFKKSILSFKLLISFIFSFAGSLNASRDANHVSHVATSGGSPQSSFFQINVKDRDLVRGKMRNAYTNHVSCHHVSLDIEAYFVC